jgi:hypothetical protein
MLTSQPSVTGLFRRTGATRIANFLVQYVYTYQIPVQGHFVARSNVARPNVAFTISAPMSPAPRLPPINVARPKVAAECRP